MAARKTIDVRKKELEAKIGYYDSQIKRLTEEISASQDKLKKYEEQKKAQQEELDILLAPSAEEIEKEKTKTLLDRLKEKGMSLDDALKLLD